MVQVQRREGHATNAYILFYEVDKGMGQSMDTIVPSESGSGKELGHGGMVEELSHNGQITISDDHPTSLPCVEFRHKVLHDNSNYFRESQINQ